MLFSPKTECRQNQNDILESNRRMMVKPVLVTNYEVMFESLNDERPRHDKSLVNSEFDEGETAINSGSRVVIRSQKFGYGEKDISKFSISTKKRKGPVIRTHDASTNPA